MLILQDIAPEIDSQVFRSQLEFNEYFTKVIAERRRIEQQRYTKDHEWWHDGYCEVCKAETSFFVNPTQKLRSTLKCKSCKIMNRRRFVATMLLKLQGPNDVYIYEQITDFYRFVEKRLQPSVRLTGSEYLAFDKKPGEIVPELAIGGNIFKNVRHENALGLSFDDGVFDVVVSQDVFEHVPDIHKTLSEAYRVLKKGGVLVSSIPFAFLEKTRQRAIMKPDGSIEHILPESYHGNPLTKKGALVFYDYGWDYLDFCKKAGFSDAYMLGYYSIRYGYMGRGIQDIWVAKK